MNLAVFGKLRLKFVARPRFGRVHVVEEPVNQMRDPIRNGNIVVLRAAVAAPRPLVLAVGTGQELRDVAERQRLGGSVISADLPDITPLFLSRFRPTLVLTPLLSPGFDCIELAERLVECRYAGCFGILTGRIPRPQIVLDEVRELRPEYGVQLADPFRVAV